MGKMPEAQNFLIPPRIIPVKLQWLEHQWLVYHGCFELVLESLGIIFGIKVTMIFVFELIIVMLCVLIRIASIDEGILLRTHNIPSC